MKYFIALILVLFFAPTQANKLYSENENDEVCKSWGSLAEKIMELRQTEAPISSVLDLIAGDDNTGLNRDIVIMAYERPAYVTKENQVRAANSFRNDIELMCFKSTPKPPL